MTSAYDAWLSTDKAHDAAEALTAAFEKSDEYMAAYVDYCDDFPDSSAYAAALGRFAEGNEDDGYDERDDYDGMAYYGLHAEDNDHIDPYGDT